MFGNISHMNDLVVMKHALSLSEGWFGQSKTQLTLTPAFHLKTVQSVEPESLSDWI